ncbi:hypothetical protein HY490_00125 [Candidatus Woesearchaeota archaeon]|nr:hypothetical protein [Candidatus Woesearchaeota archaeon]
MPRITDDQIIANVIKLLRLCIESENFAAQARNSIEGLSILLPAVSGSLKPIVQQIRDSLNQCIVQTSDQMLYFIDAVLQPAIRSSEQFPTLKAALLQLRTRANLKIQVGV